jgi:triacylglycerol lipase
MPLELIEDALGDPRNAATLAVASDLAYYPEAEGVPKFREQLGLEARLIGVGNTQVYIATNDNHIVAAFRGTEAPTSLEGLRDWFLTDAVNLLIQPQGDLGTDFAAAGVGARWHQGFIRALGDIWDPFLEAITAERKKNDRPVWLTGHSLGGALAILAGWRLKCRFVPVHQIYTFGGPMVGDAQAVAAIDKEFPGRISRYVNSPDMVPLLPTVSLLANQYSHCQKETVLGEVSEAAAGFLTQLGSKTVDGVIHGTLFDEIWTGLGTRLAAHAMENYRNLVAKLVK